MNSSIQSIPPELVVEIFKWCSDSYPLISSEATPIVLARVCKEWHAIATSSSELWANFSIEISTNKPIPPAPFVERWLQRSKFQLLNVCIKLTGHINELNTPEWCTFMQSICPVLNSIICTSSRWKTAVLSLPGTKQCLQLFEGRTAPVLQSLHLNLKGWSGDGVHHLYSLLTSANTLCDLYWYDVIHCNYLSDPPFARALKNMVHSWDNITHMHFGTWITPNDAHNLLLRCPRVVSLELDRFADKADSPTDFTTSPPLMLPNLTHLTIRHRAKDNSVAVFLHLLICPGLCSFEFSNCTGYPDVEWFKEAFTSFLIRSACHLTSLFLEYFDITEDELTACLEQCSDSLQMLEVRGKWGGNCVSDSLLSRLTLNLDGGEILSDRSTSAVLCPELEYIVLSKVVVCSNGAFARMLRSRNQRNVYKKSCVPLSHVDVRFPFSGRRNLEDIRYLDELRVNDTSAVRPNFLT